MDLAPLPVKLVRQNLANLNCLQSCALMVLQYFKVPISTDELRKKVHYYQKHSGLSGSFLTDLGQLALKKDLIPYISHYDWQWWDQETAEAAVKHPKLLVQKIKALRRIKADWGEKKIHSKEIQYLKAGGTLRFEKPALDQIELWLGKKLPVILRVWAADFFHQPKENYATFIVVTGKRENTYLVKDPQLALKTVDQEELFVAWTRASNWLMTLTPRPKKETEDQLPLFAG